MIRNRAFQIGLLGVLALGLISMIGWMRVSAAESSRSSKVPEFKFSGDYETLAPEQQRLVADWCARLSKVVGQTMKPAEVYDHISISTRTTFEAVTHALMHSHLTDASGKSLGTAIGLVDYLETVNGAVPDARGDKQFRIYVRMKPGAQKILDDCQEFSAGENKRYHPGYPLSYRQSGGVPSIQISMSANGERADIDVDYRSSKIPAAIFNGHTSAANSDVRAGDNVDRHNKRWSGLTDWWRNLFGLPVAETEQLPAGEKEPIIPREPRAGRGKIEEAVSDYLTAWLMEQKPEVALAYASRRAFACVPPDDPGQPVDLGMAPFRLLMDMATANKAIGKPARLSDVVAGVPLDAFWLKPVKKHDPKVFTLYQVADEVGKAADCAGGAKAAIAGLTETSKLNFNDYYATGFYLKKGKEHGANIYLLWTRVDKNWKVVAFTREPAEAPPLATPDLRPKEPAAPTPVRMPGDPVMTNAAGEFFTTWLVAKDSDACLKFFSPRFYKCLNAYLEEGVAPAKTPQEGAQRLREILANTATKVGKVSKLDAILQPLDPVLPGIGIVAHPNMQAFAILSVPDHLGREADCSQPSKSIRRIAEPADGPKYGNFYGTSFQFRVEGGEPASIYLLWTREGGLWKIVWLSIDTP